MTTSLEPRLLDHTELERRLLVAVARAAELKQPYAVVACVPQRLPGEDASDVAAYAAERIGAVVRDTDIVGLVEEEIIVFGLEEAGAEGARVFAHRIQSDLQLSSRPFRSTLWEPGCASRSEELNSADELLLTAVEEAMTRRRRLGG